MIDSAGELGIAGLELLELCGGVEGIQGVVPGDLISPEGAALGHIGRLRWHGGSLLAMQQTSSGPRLIRLTLDDQGKSIKRVDVVDDDLASETAGAGSGETFFYLARSGAIRSLSIQ